MTIYVQRPFSPLLNYSSTIIEGNRDFILTSLQEMYVSRFIGVLVWDLHFRVVPGLLMFFF